MKIWKTYQHKRITTQEGDIADGEYIINDGHMIIRIKKGLLDDTITEDGDILPAIENDSASHIEHWKNGVLHCDTGPAVIDTTENYESYWLNGREVDEKDVSKENIYIRRKINGEL